MTTSSTCDDDLSTLSPSDLAAYQALLLEPSSTDEEAHTFLRRRNIRLPFAAIPIYRNFLRRTRPDPSSPPFCTTPSPFVTPGPRVPCSREREHASPTPCTPPLCTPIPSPNSRTSQSLPPVCTPAQLSSAPESSFHDAMSRSLSLAQRLLDQHLLTAGPDLSPRDLCSITSAYRSLILNRLNLEKLDATQLEKAKEREKELQEAEARKDPQFLINKVRTLLGIPLGDVPGGLNEGTGFGSKAEYPPPVTDTFEEYMARLDKEIAEEKSKQETLRQLQQQNQQLQEARQPSPTPCTHPPCTPQASCNSSNDDPLPPARTAGELFSTATDQSRTPEELVSAKPSTHRTRFMQPINSG